MGAENLAPTGIQNPDIPPHSKSLYRLSHRGPHLMYISVLNLQLLRKQYGFTADFLRRLLRVVVQRSEKCSKFLAVSPIDSYHCRGQVS